MTQRLFPFFLLLFLCVPGSAKALTITFQETATLTGSEVQLADIAAITPPGQEADTLGKQKVARTPAPGQTRSLRATSIIGSLRHQVDSKNTLWQGSETIAVTRASRLISKDELEAIIAQFLIDNIEQLPTADIRFTSVKAPSEIVLPAGDIQWKVTPSRPEIVGSSSFSILFQKNGKTIKNCTVRGKLEVLTEVATLAVTLRMGDRLLPEHISMVRKDISSLREPFFSQDQVVGMQVKRTLQAGKVLERRHIEWPPAIRKGEMVKIFANKGSMRISTDGIAKTDGRPGQVIRVENINSNKLVYCRVDSPGIVSVEY